MARSSKGFTGNRAGGGQRRAYSEKIMLPTLPPEYAQFALQVEYVRKQLGDEGVRQFLAASRDNGLIDASDEAYQNLVDYFLPAKS